MPVPTPEPGLVICYVYSWKREQEEGRDEGTKARPCVFIVAARREGGRQLVTVAPITHSPPGRIQDGVEIPAATKQRLGLDAARSWVRVTEVNEFTWPGPDLRPTARDRFDYGFLPPSLFRRIRDKILERAAIDANATVARTE